MDDDTLGRAIDYRMALRSAERTENKTEQQQETREEEAIAE